MACGGVVDLDDIAPVVLALQAPAAHASAYPGCSITPADMDNSGAADGGDVQPFVDALLGG